MLIKLYQKMLVYGIIKTSKSAIAIMAITRLHKKGQGNQTIGHLRLTLSDLKFKVNSMVKEVFKWLKFPNPIIFQWRSTPK